MDNTTFKFDTDLKRNPRYVLRASIKKLDPKDKVDDVPMSQALAYDYMGAAEFEFGAIPASQARAKLRSDENPFIHTTIPSIREGGKPLIVYHCLSAVGLKKYSDFLHHLRHDPWGPNLKEVAYFCEADRQSEYRKHIDFWWDIKHEVFWSFNERFMQRLPKHLECSWKLLSDSSFEKARRDY